MYANDKNWVVDLLSAMCACCLIFLALFVYGVVVDVMELCDLIQIEWINEWTNVWKLHYVELHVSLFEGVIEWNVVDLYSFIELCIQVSDCWSF